MDELALESGDSQTPDHIKALVEDLKAHHLNGHGEPIGPPCARCDGDHRSEDCPHYRHPHTTLPATRSSGQETWQQRDARRDREGGQCMGAIGVVLFAGGVAFLSTKDSLPSRPGPCTICGAKQGFGCHTYEEGGSYPQCNPWYEAFAYLGSIVIVMGFIVGLSGLFKWQNGRQVSHYR